MIGETLGFDGSESWMVKGFLDDISARRYAQKCVIAASKYDSKIRQLEERYFAHFWGFFQEHKEKTEFDIINECDPYFYPKCDSEYRVKELEVDGKLYWGSHLELPCLNITSNDNAGLSFDT